MIRYIAGSTAAILLVLAGAAIVSFDASDPDIARPPSLEKPVTGAASPQASPLPDLSHDRQYHAASFIADPLNRYAVYLLGQAPGGELTGAERTRLLFLAADRSRRDGEIQTAAISQLLKEENYPQSLEALDGLMRSNPKSQQKIYDALTVFTRNAGSRRALVQLLAQEPPWRQDFLAYLPRSTADVRGASMLMAELRSTKSPPRTAELTPLLGKLIADGTPDEAYLLWLTSLTEAQLERAGYIYNGDFETKLDQLGPFDWRIVPAKNVVARGVENNPAVRGTVLEVSFAGSDLRYRNIYQRLLLPPGRYILTGSYRASNLDSDRGLVWRIYCVTTAEQKLAEVRR